MGISTWLKERRLERTHAKLKHLRSMQARLRDQLEVVHREQRTHGSPSTQLEARERKLMDEKEKLTRQIHDLEAEEKQLKTELQTAA